VSPSQGRKRPTFGTGGRKAGGAGPVAARRRGLLLFGVLFVALFVLVAISEGIGDPDIPSGSIVLIEEAPGDSGDITKADFDHALELAAIQAGQKKAPKPGTPKYDEAKEAALSSLLESVWIEGEGEEMGIVVSDAEIDEELAKIKKENFPTKKAFQEFLKESKYTPEDVDDRVEIQILSNSIRSQLAEDAGTPGDSEVEAYYEAAKATQFTQPEQRDVRLLVSKDRAKAEKALAELETDNTAKGWSKTAKKYSEDPATKEKGGLQKKATESTLEEPVAAAVFGSAEGQLEGPVESPRGFVVFEVQNSTPETTQPLKAVKGQIQSQLGQQLEQEEFSAFVADFNSRWRERTFCDPDYTIEQCSNFESDGRPQGAPPACYEAEPDGGPPEACPAPVFQLVPALPGSVTPLTPRGNPLAQRPVPPGEPQAASEEATGIPGAGAVPPPAEAPPSEAPPAEAPPAEAPPSE
jgi:foldase protein PrsA